MNKFTYKSFRKFRSKIALHQPLSDQANASLGIFSPSGEPLQDTLSGCKTPISVSSPPSVCLAGSSVGRNLPFP